MPDPRSCIGSLTSLGPVQTTSSHNQSVGLLQRVRLCGVRQTYPSVQFTFGRPRKNCLFTPFIGVTSLVIFQKIIHSSHQDVLYKILKAFKLQGGCTLWVGAKFSSVNIESHISRYCWSCKILPCFLPKLWMMTCKVVTRVRNMLNYSRLCANRAATRLDLFENRRYTYIIC